MEDQEASPEDEGVCVKLLRQLFGLIAVPIFCLLFPGSHPVSVSLSAGLPRRGAPACSEGGPLDDVVHNLSEVH